MTDAELRGVHRNYPEYFFEDVLGVESIEEYQRKVLRAVQLHDKLLVRSSHSLGKTWMMARIALWFYSCFDNSMVITTAPTYKQVEKLLWGELRDAYKKSLIPLGGKLLNTALNKDDKWFCLGLSPQKSAGTGDEQQGSSLQGYHSDNILVIFDEATGVPADIWKMADGLLTSGKTVKFVGIANPTTRACEFYEKFKSNAFHKIHLSCFDSPNMKANGFNDKEDLQDEIDRLMLLTEDERMIEVASYEKPVPHLASAQWVISYVLEWGMEHPLVVSKAFGEFPDDDDSVLIPMSSVMKSIDREVEYDRGELRCIGVDVARYGSDKSVLTEMVGLKQTALKSLAKRNIPEVTGHVMRMLNGEHRAHKTVVLVDSTGLGAGVFDSLIENQTEALIDRDVEIIEIHFGASPANPDESDQELIDQDKSRYFNLKAKMFQMLANDLKDKIDLFDDSNYIKELPTIKNKPNTKGKLYIESKEDYKKRTGMASPDWSDSLALCNFGRYVNITYGSFKHHESTQPLTKQPDRKPRKTGVKVREY